MSEAQTQADEIAPSDSTDPIVITGVGLLTPLGLTAEATWAAVRAGQCGVGALPAMEQLLPPGSSGGQVADLPDTFEPNLPREVRYLRRAITNALEDANVLGKNPYSPARCGFMLGTTLHGIRAGGRFLRNHNLAELADFLAGATLRRATAHIPFTGFSATTCSACSSSLGSIALGISLLRAGRLDLVVAGGYDTISEYVYGGFNSLRLVSPDFVRPFTRGRQGMKLSEGYGIVVLERASDAARREAVALAAVLGYGESADAHHLTQPDPQGRGAARAMAGALNAAGLTAGQIDLIAAHATGTPDNDAAEFAALSAVFGGDLSRIPVVGFKSHLGHTLGAAGAVELILCALSLRDQIVPGCVNVTPAQIEFAGLNVATGAARSASVRNTLNTSLGFGGANTCMVLGNTVDSCGVPHFMGGPPMPWQSAAPASRSRDDFPQPVFITGVGVVLPGLIGNEAFARRLTAPEPRRVTCDTGAIAEIDLAGLLNARRVRRVSEYVKLALAATVLACRDARIGDIPGFAENCSALLGSTHGSPGYSEPYYRQIVGEGITAANPLLFAEGVPNAAAAHLSLMLSLRGPCQTVIGTRTAGLDALYLAAVRIAAGEWDRAIVGAAEEYSPIVNAAYKQWGLYAGQDAAVGFSRGGGFVTGCGAVTLVLESARSVESRGIDPRGQILAASGPVPLPARAAHRMADALACLGDVRHIIASANGTSLDRLESGALRRGPSRVVSSLSGHIAETFSVMPLAGIAAALLTGKLPALLAPNAPTSDPSGLTLERVGVVCSDYTRLISAAGISISGRVGEV
ncbi:MAG TPA: beta-ketoacyl-[acyl-carrier-protein] synthase family protein [Tepidisphaeraceae bacterium]|nr:beta-ketoacyl-[acyl-carrier-protein] synthase family protein [Tepidisphaeraceae bacterium]